MESTTALDLPYFDLFFSTDEEHPRQSMESLVGENVHWGYWPDPALATGTVEDFQRAGERLNSELLSYVPLQPGTRLLDAGCGFGGTLRSIDRRAKNMELVGLNIDPRQVERARRITSPHADHHNRIEFVVGNACALPFADQSFDVVTAVECIFHFPSRRDFFREAHRVLKPGGVLVLSDFMLRGWGLPVMGVMYPFYAASLRRTYGSEVKSTLRSAYRWIAARTGFEVTEIRDITTNTLPTYPVLKHFSALARERAQDFYRANHFLESVSKYGVYGYELLAFRRQGM